MSLDLTSFAAALKQHYTSDRVENMVYRDNPLLALMPKYEQFGGENLKLPIKYGIPQGRSATFATAQANKTNTQFKAFLLTRSKDYSLASIDNETIEASKGNANAFMEAATTEIDGAIESVTRALAIDLYGSGSGSRGQVSASASGTSIQLKSVEDVTNFEVGMEIVVSTADGGGALKSGNVTVVGVDRDSGILTTDSLAAIDGGTGVVADDFIFQQGDYDLKIKGLRAWIPSSAPTSGDSFFGVDRSADATRLGGIRYDGSAQPIEEALIDAASRVAREGGRPDYCMMSYSKFSELEKALGSKVQYVDAHVNAEIGFRGIMINGPRGPIRCIPDQNCPADRAFMLSLTHWKLYSLGKCPKILDSDGLKMLRESSADAVEVRVGYYAQLGCRAPGFNASISL
jgi:hypothetical protein